MNRKKIVYTLKRFVALFKKWAIHPHQYSFAGDLALHLLGYRVKVRPHHFDFFVIASALPWKTVKGSEGTIPPKGSHAARDLKNFIRTTRADPHFLPLPLYGLTLKNLLNETLLYSLDQTTSIRIFKPYFLLSHYYSVLKAKKSDIFSDWPEEKVQRWFRFAVSFQKWSDTIGDRRSVVLSKKMLRLCTALQRIATEQQERRIVCHGKMQGRIRIIRSSRDLSLVRKGEILLCKKTTPHFSPYLEKAKGIITEQGGLLSHAAIFAREHKIPCIVGFRGIIRRMKNGENIVLDTTKGLRMTRALL